MTRRNAKQKKTHGSSKSLKRKSLGLPPKPRILIVCEGAETEPKYLNRLRRELRLSKDLLKIVGGDLGGSNPKSLAEYAREKNIAAHQERFSYDEVWCVFDRDQHTRIEEAFIQIRDNNFKSAFSNPSFELWFLLHFQNQTASIERRVVLRELKKHLRNYEKSLDVYDDLKPKQADAIERARNLRKNCTASGTVPECPYTNVDELLQSISKAYTK
ncbi:MAG: RloB family protein [Phycisphaerales bacterium]|nr:RloB family protein [Phycisphaerales bacterium]